MEIGQKAIDLSLKERLLTKFWTVWLSERSYDSQFYHLGGRPLKIHFPDHSCGPLPMVTSTRARTHTHTHTHTNGNWLPPGQVMHMKRAPKMQTTVFL